MPDNEWNANFWTKDLDLWEKERPDFHYGYQWGDPDAEPFLLTVRDEWLQPLLSAATTVLEIGCGGGRWTQFLLGAKRIFCVDINEVMFHHVLRRLGAQAHLSFCHTSGTDFPGIEPESIDLAFTFGTFVHLDADIIGAYLASLRPLMKTGGDLLLHYSDKEKPLAAENETFAHTTTAIMEGLLGEHGYSIERHGTDFLPHSNIVHAKR